MYTHSYIFWALNASLYVCICNVYVNHSYIYITVYSIQLIYENRGQRKFAVHIYFRWLRFEVCVYSPMHWSIRCMLQFPHVLHDFSRPPRPTVNSLVWTYQLLPFCTASWCLQIVHDIVQHLSPLQVAQLQKLRSVVEHVREPIHRLVHCLCVHWVGRALMYTYSYIDLTTCCCT